MSDADRMAEMWTRGRAPKEPDPVLARLDLQAFFGEAIARGIQTLATLSDLKQRTASGSPDLRKRIEAAIPVEAWTNVTDRYTEMVEKLADTNQAEAESLGR
jgi:hypothetical protein